MFRAIITAAFIPLLAGCKPAGAPDPRQRPGGPVAVTLGEAREVKWEQRILLVGTLLPAQEARLAAEVEGRIEKTLVEIGDAVKAGQELAQIDTASYQGMVNMWTANHNKAQINADNATVNLERLDKLRSTGAVSSTAYDDALAVQRAAIAEVAATKAQLGGATTSLKRSTLLAPFDGRITARAVTEGDFARIGTVMFTIVDAGTLRFRGEVPERDGPRVSAGQTVRLHVESWPERDFEGRITWVNPAVNPATRGVEIEARVENKDGALKANNFARGEIIVAGAAPVLVVPADAVTTFVGVNKVFTIAGGKAVPREVQLGEKRGEEQAVLSGLKAGDQVIVGGLAKVQPGTAVSPK
ncbi:MAG: efflux RND transporter periplasmic adaptor subunit [Chthoniobacteraceae bacterium]